MKWEAAQAAVVALEAKVVAKVVEVAQAATAVATGTAATAAEDMAASMEVPRVVVAKAVVAKAEGSEGVMALILEVTMAAEVTVEVQGVGMVSAPNRVGTWWHPIGS